MKTPTKFELDLPWHSDWVGQNDEQVICTEHDENMIDGGIKTNFAIHAANTYHEREQLLMKACDILTNLLGIEPIGRHETEEIIKRICTTLAPPTL